MSQADSSSAAELTSLSLKSLQQGIQSGGFSVMEVTEAYLARIARFDGELNTYITATQDSAREQAQVIDNRIRSGELSGAMAGIPYALKDLFCTDGVLCSMWRVSGLAISTGNSKGIGHGMCSGHYWNWGRIAST